MKSRFIILCCLFMLVTSCKTLIFDHAPQTRTTQQVTLGSIGADKDFIFQNEFNSVAIPNYIDPIKINVALMSFNKQTYKTFTNAKALQSTKVTIQYVDSIESKPTYLHLQIADKVAVIKALNNPGNKGIKDYLSLHAYANVLTSISLACTTKDLEAIMDSEAVFLIENGLKTYALELYKGNKKTETIPFNQGVVFGYKTSNCCWQENKRHQIEIVDLVNVYTNCPNRTYRSAKKAEKNINYYKL